MQTIMDLVKPQPEAKWVVFYSLGDGADKGVYYDAHPIEHMGHHLTMLAYDMNDEPLHASATARRCGCATRSSSASSRSSGSRASSSSPHYSEIGGGYGGYNQDHEFFGYRQSI